MDKTILLLIGGFLGAGKTTLMKRAADALHAGGRRVGVITNDQAAGMVDTRLFQLAGIPVREVSGSCFCCNFPALTQAMDSLRTEEGAEIIIAESVGSCTDLSATIMQPLKASFADRYAMRPISVVIDPERLREAFPGRLTASPESEGKNTRLHASAAYIVRKQLEEADVILVNKSDILTPDEKRAVTAVLEEQYPATLVLELSALTGEGADHWLALAMQGEEAGARLAEVDYDVYAEGEAILGWLNASVELSAKAGADWNAFFRTLFESMAEGFRSGLQDVGHVKLLLSAGGESLAGNLVSTGKRPFLTGGVSSRHSRAELLVNARVETTPARLESLALALLREACGKYDLACKPRDLKCLSPGRPEPTWRYDHVVGATG